jgi:hypothetical protein
LNDSIWAVVLGASKNLGVTPDYILYGMTYENLILYSMTIPEMDFDKDKKKENDRWTEECDRLDANVPDNKNIG